MALIFGIFYKRAMKWILSNNFLTQKVPLYTVNLNGYQHKHLKERLFKIKFCFLTDLSNRKDADNLNLLKMLKGKKGKVAVQLLSVSRSGKPIG